jgi:hypothetical protein
VRWSQAILSLGTGVAWDDGQNELPADGGDA